MAGSRGESRRRRRAGRGAARAHPAPQRAVPHARLRPRSPTPSTTCSSRAAPARGGAPRARHARLADPARWGPRPRACSKRSATGCPMMSLDNAFDEDELRAWAERLRRQDPDLDLETLAFSCEPKVDGVAMSLTYERGRFVQAATRGDGVTGEDVTANVATVQDVPKELAKAGGPYPDVLEVRGEIYMPVAEFEAMNKRQADAGRAPLRQPAQLRRRRAAPEGPGGHGHAAAALLGLPGRRRRGRAGQERRGRRPPRPRPWPGCTGRLPRQPRGPAGQGHRRGRRPLPGAGGGAPRPAPTRSTAW